jgi:small subunit ribosomal protein S1
MPERPTSLFSKLLLIVQTPFVFMTAETDNSPKDSAELPKKRLIGSQRNPDAYRPQPTIPIVDGISSSPQTRSYPPSGKNSNNINTDVEHANTDRAEAEHVEADCTEKNEKAVTSPTSADDEGLGEIESSNRLPEEAEGTPRSTPPPPDSAYRVQIPKIRAGKMSDDLEDELNAVLSGIGGESIDSLIDCSQLAVDLDVLETEKKIKATVLALQGDSVFLDIGAREQGVVSLRMFPPDAEPQRGQVLEVTVVRFMPDEGLYDVSVPLAAADVRDWSQVHEGMVVEVKITKTNSGGLECEVNRLRGFIPISQIDVFRVENLEQYVGQKMTCIVEEVNPERRNLVLSRRALLNREREEKRTALLHELEVGQIREGLVRKIIDGGAFVDLGGVDGFIPIGAMSWGRINHPNDVLSEGTRVKVRISKIDETANRISLVYRDDASNPWSNIQERFQEKTLARGKVTKIADFGAFIELMPGLEGLVHLSELSTKRVMNVREVVKEGEWVDVYILSIDSESKRISLSIKQAAPVTPEPVTDTAVNDSAGINPENAGQSRTPSEPTRPPVKIKNPHKGPLKGGTSQTAGGESFGLKW